MGRKDPWVDAYVARAADFAKPILEHLRQLVHSACPEVEETRKWAFPHFMYKGMLCAVAGFKHHCAFVFWHKLMRESVGAGKSKEAMGQLGKIASLSDLPKDAVLTRYIKEAMRLNEAGIKAPAPKRTAVKKPEIPDSIAKALKKNKKAKDNFHAMSPSHQKEYVQWITEAKRQETVVKRLATMVEWLAEGKARNWKYERC